MYVFHIICIYIISTVSYSSFVVVGWGPWSGCDRPCGGCGISRRQQLCNDTIDETQRWVPSNVEYKTHRIPKPKCFSARLAVVFAQSIEDRCEIENEDVVGDASTASQWSTILLPMKVPLILEVWGQVSQKPRGLCNTWYHTETNLKVKSCEISFAYNLFLRYETILIFHFIA